MSPISGVNDLVMDGIVTPATLAEKSSENVVLLPPMGKNTSGRVPHGRWTINRRFGLASAAEANSGRRNIPAAVAPMPASMARLGMKLFSVMAVLLLSVAGDEPRRRK